MFDDLLEANRRYRTAFHDSGVEGKAARGLAVLTCIDSRIDPLAMLGLRAGDAKIIRNAGARVTEDSLRSLVLAANLLGVRRVCVEQSSEAIGPDSEDPNVATRHDRHETRLARQVSDGADEIARLERPTRPHCEGRALHKHMDPLNTLFLVEDGRFCGQVDLLPDACDQRQFTITRAPQRR